MGSMILLLSDNPQKAGTIKEDLNREGFGVEVVNDHETAIARLKKNDGYRTFLLDFEYADYDVFEICQKVKRDAVLQSIPLICIIAQNRFVDQLLAFEMGADDFILMPYSSLEIQLKMRSLQRIIDLQNQLLSKDTQLENLRNIQRIMVTLNQYINNALTPLYFAVQIMEEGQNKNVKHCKQVAKDTVEFISKVLQNLHQIVQSGKERVLKEGVYKDMIFEIEQELNKLIEKSK
jgi:PleD family two-component response regulator